MKINNSFTQNKNAVKSAADPKKINRICVRVALIIIVLFAIPLLFFGGLSPNMIPVTLIALSVIFVLSFLLTLLIMNLHYKNKRLLKFVILFSILFLVTTYIFETIFHSVI